MIVIQNVLGLIMSEATMQYGVNAPTIQNISYEEMMSSLVSNVPSIFATHVGLELLGAQV